MGGGVGAKYKKGHLSKFSQQAPSTAHNVYFSGFLNSLEAKINFKLYLKHEWKKIDMWFLWIHEKGLSVKVSKFFFCLKISTVQTFNCKRSQKIPKVRLLSSFASQNTLATFFRFISSVFSLCIESSIQWFNLFLWHCTSQPVFNAAHCRSWSFTYSIRFWRHKIF